MSDFKYPEDTEQVSLQKRVLTPYEKPFYDFLDSTTEYSSVEVQENIRQLFNEYVIGGIERGIDLHLELSSTVFEIAMAMAISEQLYGLSLRECKAMDRLLVKKIAEWSCANILNVKKGKQHDEILEREIKILWQNVGQWVEMPIMNPLEWEPEGEEIF